MATIDECHASMGAMIFTFQELEHELVRIYVHLEDPAKLNELSKNYVAFSRVMKNLLEVADKRLKDNTTKRRLDAMVQRALQYADRRNTFVHSHYDMRSWDFRGVVSFEREKGKFGGIKKAHEPQYQTFNPDALYKLAEDIRKRIMPVVRIHERIIDELHPGLRYEEHLRDMELEKYYDQMPIPEEFYESFRLFSKAVQVGSIRLPTPL